MNLLDTIDTLTALTKDGKVEWRDAEAPDPIGTFRWDGESASVIVGTSNTASQELLAVVRSPSGDVVTQLHYTQVAWSNGEPEPAWGEKVRTLRDLIAHKRDTMVLKDLSAELKTVGV